MSTGNGKAGVGASAGGRARGARALGWMLGLGVLVTLATCDHPASDHPGEEREVAIDLLAEFPFTDAAPPTTEILMADPDLTPTLLVLTGLPLPAGLDGVPVLDVEGWVQAA